MQDSFKPSTYPACLSMAESKMRKNILKARICLSRIKYRTFQNHRLGFWKFIESLLSQAHTMILAII